MSTIKQLHRSESGIASLIITIVLMVIISLIVVGFAQVSRREQQGSLDRQLSTQAFYAAESGVNDVKALLAGTAANDIVAKTTCQSDGSTPAAEQTAYNSLKTKYTLSDSNDVGYTCLLVSPFVSQLNKQQDADTDWVVPIVPIDSSNESDSLGDLHVSWTPASGTTPIAGCTKTNQPVTTRSCNYSVLRFEIVPVTNPSRSSLSNTDMVSYLYPVQGGDGSLSYSATGASGSTGVQQIGANCNGTNCSVDVKNLPASPSGYYLRLHALYLGTTVAVSGTDTSNSAVRFSGAQVQVDSTGKAQDVLRRIRVSYSLTSSSNGNYAQDAIETRDSICKRFATTPDKTLATGNLESGNPYCGNTPVALP